MAGSKKKNTVDADAMEALAVKVRKSLVEMDAKIDKTRKAIDKMAQGDGTTAFWSGERAAGWYAQSYKNIANSYIRVARIADAMRVSILYTLDAYKKDSKTSKAKLNTLKGRFIEIRDQAKKKAKAIATGA